MFSRFLFAILIAFLTGGPFHLLYGQVLNYETKVSIDGDGKKSTERIVLIQINSKEENSLSHIELNHNPNQEISVNYAYILNEEGKTVRKLKQKELKSRNDLSYQAFYQDNLITEFDLCWNQYPYRIEYSYTVEEDQFLYIAWWTPLLLKNVKTLKSSLEVSLPSDFQCKISNPNNVSFKESEADNRRILAWSAHFNDKHKKETFAPAFESLLPVVKLVPEKFTYGVPGKTDSWASFGAWLDALNLGNDQLPLQEQWVIEKVAEGIGEKTEIIKALYHFLQDQTKYINVSIEVGGLKSYPASYVSQNKYGDCKALTTYMKAALKSVGIESFYTIVRAGEKNIEIDTSFPSQQFNHVILMVPVNNDTIWLENTASHTPFNYLGTFTQNRYALVVGSTKSKLVKTPELSIEDVLLERNYCFQVSGNKDVHAGLDLLLRGKAFERFRYYMFEKEEEHINNAIDAHHGLEGLTVNNWDTIGFNRDSAFLHLNLEGVSSSIIRELGGFYVITPLRIELPDFTKPSERKLDVLIPSPINKVDKSVYDLQGFKRNDVQLPEGIRIENEYGAYHTVFKRQGNELTVIEKFTLFTNSISIENYAGLYDFIDSINKYKKKTAILIR